MSDLIPPSLVQIEQVSLILREFTPQPTFGYELEQIVRTMIQLSQQLVADLQAISKIIRNEKHYTGEQYCQISTILIDIWARIRRVYDHLHERYIGQGGRKFVELLRQSLMADINYVYQASLTKKEPEQQKTDGWGWISRLFTVDGQKDISKLFESIETMKDPKKNQNPEECKQAMQNMISGFMGMLSGGKQDPKYEKLTQSLGGLMNTFFSAAKDKDPEEIQKIDTDMMSAMFQNLLQGKGVQIDVIKKTMDQVSPGLGSELFKVVAEFKKE